MVVTASGVVGGETRESAAAALQLQMEFGGGGAGRGTWKGKKESEGGGRRLGRSFRFLRFAVLGGWVPQPRGEKGADQEQEEKRFRGARTTTSSSCDRVGRSWLATREAPDA